MKFCRAKGTMAHVLHKALSECQCAQIKLQEAKLSMGNCAHTENAKSKKIVDDHRLLDFEDLTAFLELFDGLRLALAVSSRPDCPPTHVLSVQHLQRKVRVRQWAGWRTLSPL